MTIVEEAMVRRMPLSAFSVLHRHSKRALPEAFRGVDLVCHRGAHEHCPENSLSAFRAAADHGYGVELDVQCSKDGHVLVFHDRTLERMTGSPGVMAELGVDELRALRLRHENIHTDERIPALQEVMESFAGPVIVEIKAYGAESCQREDAVVAELKCVPDAYDRVIVESFDPHVLRRVRELDPSLYRCQLFGEGREAHVSRWRRFLRRHLALNVISQPDAIAGRLSFLSKRETKRYRERYGYSVLGWTAKSPEDLKLAKSLGLQIVISDYIPEDAHRRGTEVEPG